MRLLRRRRAAAHRAAAAARGRTGRRRRRGGRPAGAAASVAHRVGAHRRGQAEDPAVLRARALAARRHPAPGAQDAELPVDGEGGRRARVLQRHGGRASRTARSRWAAIGPRFGQVYARFREVQHVQRAMAQRNATLLGRPFQMQRVDPNNKSFFPPGANIFSSSGARAAYERYYADTASQPPPPKGMPAAPPPPPMREPRESLREGRDAREIRESREPRDSIRESREPASVARRGAPSGLPAPHIREVERRGRPPWRRTCARRARRRGRTTTSWCRSTSARRRPKTRRRRRRWRSPTCRSTPR